MANLFEYLPAGRPAALGALRGAILAASLCLGGCQSSGPQDITGSISADPRNFILKMPLKDLMINRVLPEWKRRSEYYSLDIEIRNYVTAGSAAASDERFKLIWPME